MKTKCLSDMSTTVHFAESVIEGVFTSHLSELFSEGCITALLTNSKGFTLK